MVQRLEQNASSLQAYLRINENSAARWCLKIWQKTNLATIFTKRAIINQTSGQSSIKQNFLDVANQQNMSFNWQSNRTVGIRFVTSPFLSGKASCWRQTVLLTGTFSNSRVCRLSGSWLYLYKCTLSLQALHQFFRGSKESKCLHRFQCHFRLQCYWSSQAKHLMDQERWFSYLAMQLKCKGQEKHPQWALHNESEEGGFWRI